MRGIMLPALGVVAAVMLAFVAMVGVQAQPAPPSGDAHPMLPGLEGIPPDQLFSHFMGAQVNLTDKNGVAVVVHVTPGTISSVGDGNLGITPNGQTTTQTFRITATTTINAFPKQGSLQALVAGDEVVVVTQGDSVDALTVAKKHAMGGMGGHPMGDHPMFR